MMSAGSVTRQDVLRKLDQLPPEGLTELALFIDFLAFKERRPPQRKARRPATSGSAQERLAREYDELATLYDELATELSDEAWLPLENEALLHAERQIGKEVTS
jgi:hypothetical protein